MTPMRDWFEQQRWYWFSITFDFTPLPYHWQREYTNYGWGYRIVFGPFGVTIIKPSKKKGEK